MAVHRLASEDPVELYVFARFHVHSGQEGAAAEAVRETVAHTGQEPGCLSIHGFQSKRDPRLFYIHSRWPDEAAFDLHATLPHTVRYLERMDRLIDQPREVTRTEMVA